MSPAEKDLVKKSQQGDMEAFEQLIGDYQKKVFNIALGMMNNYDDASDISQEVLIKVFKSIGSFRQQSSFSTWIYRITVNTCLDELRKRKNTKNTFSLNQAIQLEDSEISRQVEDDGPTPESEAERNEIKKMVREAIFQLSDEYKTAIILRDIQGFSYEDIARIINCPEGTVKSRINRARAMLKDILKSKMELWDKNYVK